MISKSFTKSAYVHISNIHFVNTINNAVQKYKDTLFDYQLKSVFSYKSYYCSYLVKVYKF